MPYRMPERMSYRIPDRMSIEGRLKCQNVCQLIAKRNAECQIECQVEYQVGGQIECQMTCQGGDHPKQRILFVLGIYVKRVHEIGAATTLMDLQLLLHGCQG